MRFSIITVTYNAEDVVRPTVKSVVDQEFKDYEYIIIDGESDDRTLSIVEEFRSSISILVSESDKGIYDAMNKGLKLASGEYILFLNAGDRLYSANTLTHFNNQISSDTHIISGDYVIVENTGDAYGNYITTQPCLVRNLKRDFYSCHQSIFIRSSIFCDFDLSYKILSDYKNVLDASRRCEQEQIMHVNEPIVYYLKGGVSDRRFLQNMTERIKLHYYEFGLLNVFRNTPIYLRRILREIKSIVLS